jgi:hypothetical protein
MDVIRNFFQKYRGATSPEAMPIRPVILPDPSGRFSGIFPDLNPPTRTRKHASK